MKLKSKISIKKGDVVKIISGKDRGKTGKVLQVLPEYHKVSVEGLNIMVKNLRPNRRNEKGQKIQYPAPMDVSNVELVCTKCSKPTRTGNKILENGKKVRICRKCKELT